MASPLTALLEYIQMLLDGTVGTPSEEQQALLTEARGAAHRVVERMREIGDAGRLEAGLPLEARLGPVDLVALLKPLSDWAEPMLAKVDQEIRIRIDEPIPWVQGDAHRCSQLLRHLVENMHKSSPISCQLNLAVSLDPGRDGSVRLTLSNRSLEPNADEEGDPLRFVTDPFGTSDSPMPGGAGSMLVPGIARAIGAEVGFSGGPGRGMRILVRFPIHTGPPCVDASRLRPTAVLRP